MPPSTDSRDLLYKIKNRIFENFKISRTPLDLGCHLVDLTSLNLIVPPSICCYNDFFTGFISGFRNLKSFNKQKNAQGVLEARFAE